MSLAPRPLHEQVAAVDFTADDGTPMQLCVTRYRQPIYWGRFSMRVLRACIFSEQVHKDQLYELCKRELQYQKGILANSPWLQRGSADWPPAHSTEWFERAIPLQVESNGSGGVHASALQPPAIYLKRLRDYPRQLGCGKVQYKTHKQWSEVRASLADKNAELKRKLREPVALRDVIAAESELPLSTMDASECGERLYEEIRSGAWVQCSNQHKCMVCACADGYLVWSIRAKQPVVNLLYMWGY